MLKIHNLDIVIGVVRFITTCPGVCTNTQQNRIYFVGEKWRGRLQLTSGGQLPWKE